MGFLRKLFGLPRLVKEIARLSSMAGAQSIARRLFVTNAFDGLLSALGIVMGLYLANASNPLLYIAGVAGGASVMGFFSGFVATYLSERAERLRELRETERAMLHSLRGSVYWRMAMLVPIYVAFWSCVGSILPPLISIIPFLVAHLLGYSVSALHVYSSVAVMLVQMFALGYYMGKISKESPWLSGLRFLMIGLSAATVLTVLALMKFVVG